MRIHKSFGVTFLYREFRLSVCHDRVAIARIWNGRGLYFLTTQHGGCYQSLVHSQLPTAITDAKMTTRPIEAFKTFSPAASQYIVRRGGCTKIKIDSTEPTSTASAARILDPSAMKKDRQIVYYHLVCHAVRLRAESRESIQRGLLPWRNFAMQPD